MANESVTINSGVSIGAPQTWTTVAGKSLVVNGNVNTILSTLTSRRAGATTIHHAIGNGCGHRHRRQFNHASGLFRSP